MVLRTLLISILLLSLSSTDTYARKKKLSKDYKRVFNSAKRAYKEGRYQQTVSILRRRFDLKSKSTPSGALELAAYAFEKMGKFQNAETLHRFLIKKKFNRMDKRIYRAYNKSQSADDLPDDISESLLKHYYFLARVLTSFYLKQNADITSDGMVGIKNEIKLLTEVLEEEDYDDHDPEALYEKLENKNKVIHASLYKGNWYFSGAYVTWRDKMELTTASGTTVNVKSTLEGWCLGGGYKWENSDFIWNADGCYAAASGTVGNDSSLIGYRQENVPVNAIIIGPSGLYKPTSGEVAFGLQLPLVYRKGDYTEPAGYTLDKQTILTWGYLFQGIWSVDDWSFVSKWGKFERMSSTLWLFQGIYNF